MLPAAGNELENVLKNPSLNDLVGGISSVTLGDDEARRRSGSGSGGGATMQKSVLERQVGLGGPVGCGGMGGVTGPGGRCWVVLGGWVWGG